MCRNVFQSVLLLCLLEMMVGQAAAQNANGAAGVQNIQIKIDQPDTVIPGALIPQPDTIIKGAKGAPDIRIPNPPRRQPDTRIPNPPIVLTIPLAAIGIAQPAVRINQTMKNSYDRSGRPISSLVTARISFADNSSKDLQFTVDHSMLKKMGPTNYARSLAEQIKKAAGG